ncbi:MAG: hypothetical protein A2X08_14545 [Bacteroidetes bacterium GWA2_32_17]|nr:MAG: hypothetical protein A2X08_14545 [Bacteroidetes bacterium GWA2_32_17]
MSYSFAQNDKFDPKNHVGQLQSRSVIQCKIWRPESFCNIPDSISLPSWRADSLKIESVSCEQLDKIENPVGVWLVLSKKNGSSFSMVSGLKNINIVKKNSKKIIPPTAILWNLAFSDKHGYLSSNFKTNSFKAKFASKKKIDLIIIFPGAEKGDKVIIDDFIEAIVHE